MAGQITRKKVVWRIENFTRNAIEEHKRDDSIDYYSDNFEISINGKKSYWHVGVLFEHGSWYDLLIGPSEDELENQNGPILCRANIISSVLYFDNQREEVHDYTEYFVKNDFHEEDETKVYDYDHDLFNYANVKKVYGWDFDDSFIPGFHDTEELLLDERNNGIITIIFDIEIEDLDKDFRQKINADNSFSKSIARFFNSDIFSDLIIVCSDGLEIPAHRMIIASRCEALQSAVLDNETEKLIIEDIEGDVMLEVLRYIYSGTVENLYELVVAIFLAGEKFNLTELKTLCESELIQEISSLMILQLLMFAEDKGATNLEFECLEYIKMNFNNLSTKNMCDLQRSEAWKVLGYRLILKILKSAKNFSKNVIHLTSEL